MLTDIFLLYTFGCKKIILSVRLHGSGNLLLAALAKIPRDYLQAVLKKSACSSMNRAGRKLASRMCMTMNESIVRCLVPTFRQSSQDGDEYQLGIRGYRVLKMPRVN